MLCEQTTRTSPNRRCVDTTTPVEWLVLSIQKGDGLFFIGPCLTSGFQEVGRMFIHLSVFVVSSSVVRFPVLSALSADLLYEGFRQNFDNQIAKHTSGRNRNRRVIVSSGTLPEEESVHGVCNPSLLKFKLLTKKSDGNLIFYPLPLKSDKIIIMINNNNNDIQLFFSRLFNIIKLYKLQTIYLYIFFSFHSLVIGWFITILYHIKNTRYCTYFLHIEHQ